MMKEMKLGHILIENRRKRGITQDELAAYIGVSKGAVSKWETGSSLPDISLLPQLASYFDISIDELIGYQPQMEKSDIKKLYIRLSKDFSVLPFDEVLAGCLEIIKKYYSCYPLLFQLGALLINHIAQASSSEQTAQIMEKALECFQRVRTEADEPNLQKEALLMEAFCLLQLRRPSEVIDILEPVETQANSSETLLALAYRMTDNDHEAKKILQAGIYKEMISLIDLFPSYLSLCLNDAEQFAEACRRFYQIRDAFQIKTLHPGILFGVYIAIAQGWLTLGDTEQALDILTQYTDLAVSDIYPLRLHGDKFFYLLDEWFDGELMLGSFPPRNETLIRHSMTQALSENPAFLPLAENPRFQAMVNRLRANEEGK
ncbi:MAG: helix-turn-helix transcriptional regulator [Eubacteriales bacterium]|nr:helix-turn-helix transcriptional regulator [Eubacteriales bacterium]